MKTIFDNCLIKAEFTNELKLADINPTLKKKILPGLLVFFAVFQKS